MDYTPTEQVLDIGNLNITGNIIPELWWQNIKYENGKPNFLAIIILAEIVYWYRPTEVRDEATGKLSGYKKKFKADFLQRDTKSLASKFGVSYKQANDALNALQAQSLIVRHKRNITYGEGRVCSNVQFLEIIPKNVKKITTYLHESNYPLTSTSPPLDVDVTTYTETTTKTTTKEDNVYEETLPSPQEGKKQEKRKKPKTVQEAIDRFKLTTQQSYSLIWLAEQKDIDSDLETLSWWATTYTIHRLETIYSYAKKHSTTSVGAMMNTLLRSDAIVESDTLERNRAYAKKFKIKNQWHVLQIKKKYAIIKMVNGSDHEISFHLPEKEFKQVLENKYQALFER